MINKRKIDLKRDSGGMSHVGTKEDGAILELTSIGERLFAIKEKAIYELIRADDIDPDRTNIDLPNNIQRLVINLGSDSEMASRTFMTAKTLLKSEYFNDEVNIEKTLTFTIDLLKELVVLESEIEEYLLKEKSMCDEYEERRNLPSSYAIPSITDVETRCKTIFQKADHIEQIIIDIVIEFYPKDGLNKQAHFPKLYTKLEEKYGKNDPFVEFINGTLVFMKIVRSIRNSLDHRLGFAKIKDFELRSDFSLVSPTIELDDRAQKNKLERVSLSSFLPLLVDNMITIFEDIIAFLCDRNSKKSFMNERVKMIPIEKRRYKYVKYSFWSQIGDSGYYHQ